jgi:pentatricopeptide repeat protein
MKDTESFFRKLFEACGACKLSEDARGLFEELKELKIDPDKETFAVYF